MTATPRGPYGPTLWQACVVLVLMVWVVLWCGAWITFYVFRPIVQSGDAARHGLIDAAPAVMGALPW